MKHELTVRSTVIDWTDQTLEITDTTSSKHIVSLGKTITVTMNGYPEGPERETKTMLAGELGEYMSKGYIIQQVSYEE